MKCKVGFGIVLSVLCLMFWGSVGSYAANNIGYLQSVQSKVGLINGATMSAQTLSNMFYSVELDRSGVPMFKKGDFNGDGRDDLLNVYRFSPTQILIQAIDVSNNGALIASVVLTENFSNNLVANFKKLIYIDVGDFNGDGIDDVVLVYQNTDGHHETSKTITVSNYNWTTLSGPYDITNDWAYGSMCVLNTGCFQGGSHSEVIYVYNNVDNVHQTALTYNVYSGSSTDNGFVKVGGPYDLTNTSMGKIKFMNIGDFDGNGSDDLNFIYVNDTDPNNPHYKQYWSLSYVPVGNPNFPTLGGPYELTNQSMGKVEFSRVGDFNNDGKDDMIFVFANDIDQRDWTLAYNPIYTNFPQVGALYQLTNSSMGKVRTLDVGDFNGDGTVEMCFTFRTDNQSSVQTLAYYVNPSNQVFTPMSDYPASVLMESGVPIDASTLYTVTLGPETKYMSRLSDKNYTPLTKTRTGGGNVFLFGWWSSLGMVTDFPNYDNYGANQTLYQPLGNILYTQDPGNMVSLSMGADYCIGTTTWPNEIDKAVHRMHNDPGYQVTPPLAYTKNVLVQAYGALKYSPAYVTTNPNTGQTETYYEYPKIFYPYSNPYWSKFLSIDSYPNISGYYIGDDISDVVQRHYPYNEPSTTYFTVSDLQSLNSFVHSYSNKWTFAGETYNGFCHFYNDLNISVCDVPVLYEYIFWAPNSPGSFANSGFMVDITTKLEDLKAKTKAFGQPGFLYAAQGDADIALNPNQTFNRRSPTYSESRYDVFNAIIHGAGGVSFWEVNVSCVNVMSNLQLISSKEISTDQPGTLYRALCSGYVTGYPVICSKDGYNKDFDTPYSNGTIGRPVSDINYVLRSETGSTTKYLLTVNNSENYLTSTTFYLPNSVATATETDPNGGTGTTYGLGYFYKKGITYKTLTIAQYQPFEVKIFKIGPHQQPPPPPAKQSSLVSTNIASTTPESFVLHQNFPNPFNPTTTIVYDLPKDSHVRITMFDILGREVTKLVDEEKAAGIYSIKFDGSALGSGVYFYRIEANGFTATNKLILMR